jgi:FkbM family methyltransferase
VRVRSVFVRALRKLAAAFGLDLVPRSVDALERLARTGVKVRTVLDIGAALGDWTRSTAAVFPSAVYVLVEPLEEFSQCLESASRGVNGSVVQAAAASTSGEGTLHVHRDLVGSSLLREREGPTVDGEPRTVATTTIDELVADRQLGSPFLVKLDVQGAELDVLSGAKKTLGQASAVVVEVSFFSFYFGGARFEDLISTMHDAGLVVYDVENLSRRPLDGALAQADVYFVREDSPARGDHIYASPAQRKTQDAEFAATIRRRIAREAGR